MTTDSVDLPWSTAATGEIRPPETRECWSYVCDVCDPPPADVERKVASQLKDVT